MDELTLTLHHPLTDKEWDDITDVDFEHTNEITFYTKNGKEVAFAKKPHWIPCSERLPEEQVDVLCCFTSHGKYSIRVSHRMDYNYWSGVGRTSDKVYWMPLPSPYQSESEE